MLIDGIHVPLTAPFYRDGRSYLRKLEHNADRYSLGPVAGLVTLPPGGESYSEAEAADVLKAVSEFAAPDKVLVAGVAKDSVMEAVHLAELAAGYGFDALLVSAPSNWPHAGISEAEMLVHFRMVADASPLPVLLWNGSAPWRQLTVTAVAELAAHGNIIGLYDAELTKERLSAIASATSSKSREVSVTPVFAPITRRMKTPAATGAATFVPAQSLGGGVAVAVAVPAPALKMRTKAVGFQMMSAGRAGALVPLLEAGVAGAMPKLAACVPQAVHEVYAAFKDGDLALSAEKAARLDEADLLIQTLGVAGVKYACDLNGYFGGQPRLPRLPLSGADRERVDEALAGLRS